MANESDTNNPPSNDAQPNGADARTSTGRPPAGPSRGARQQEAPTPGPQAAVQRTPGTVGSGDDVVNATPLPITPGPLRRELGNIPVRFSPGAGGTQGNDGDGSNAGTPTETYMVGAMVDMDDTERRVRAFINDFALGKPRASGNETPQENGQTEQNPDQPQPEEDEIQPNRSAPTTPAPPAPEQPEASKPFYIDQLHHLHETGDSIVNIDMTHIHIFDAGLYRKTKAYPNEVITILDSVVSSIFKEIFPDEREAIDAKRRKDLQVRTYNMLASHVQSMRELNPADIANMVAVRGMVIRASSIIPDIQRAMYQCSKCRNMVDVGINHGRIEEPRRCSSCNTRDAYTLIHSRSKFADKQMVRLQEAPESIPKGETPATFTLVMYDSLVDAVKPGDRVEITGILRATPVRVNPKLRVVRSVFRTYIDCVHVRTLNNNQSRTLAYKDAMREKNAAGQPTDPNADIAVNQDAVTEEQQNARKHFFETLACDPQLYSRLAKSLAPSIFGMDDEKKGVLLQLFGGASKSKLGQANEGSTDSGSARFRSSINVLLVGDPGTSKSQLLHSAHRLAPRGVYTSGRGSSAVGLTAYVTRDPDSDDYVLESGALVLSDRGICCIDEFDKMSDFARSVLHEAMEQQTVSIAKAGIIATLNARTAVLAAANPVNSRYDTSKTVVDNIDLPPTLLSRFDLIYLVLDAPSADSDRRLAQHIVSLFFKNYDDPVAKEAEGTNGEAVAANEDELLDAPAYAAPEYGSSEMLDAKTLTEYIAYSREKVDPTLSDSAAEALINGYVDMRAGGRGTGNMTATPRQLESLIRLAEAHARMQLKDVVDHSDVDEAMRLVKSALHMAAYDPNTGRIDMSLFAAGSARGGDTKTQYLGQAVLDKLREISEGRGMQTGKLLSKLRETSDTDISAGDLRETLRKLVAEEKIVMTAGGSGIQLI